MLLMSENANSPNCSMADDKKDIIQSAPNIIKQVHFISYQDFSFKHAKNI